jgi:hypothetical protein
MEKLQKDFETSAQNNNNHINALKNNIIDNKIKKNTKEFIKSQEEILYESYNYRYMSEIEKRIIRDQIILYSEQRIKNYSNLFSIINSAIIDIKECLVILNTNKGRYNILNRNFI